MSRDLDVIVFGATGFTGRLVADYLRRSAEHAPVRWAIAGRSRDKLEALGKGVPILVADALDPAAMRELARRTKVICTTAGPFARYGSELVAACADAGTHYCDLTGEVAWMRRMIDAHHARAQETGARIVHTCGFDSIPSDLGTWATQQAFIERFGHPARKVTALYGEQSGGFSGGTLASALDTTREASDDPAVRALLGNPYALDPDPGAPWGADFVYREVMSAPGNARGAIMAVGIAGGLAALQLALTRPLLRDLIGKRGPQPGEGPSDEVRARGHWKLRLVAEGAPDEVLAYVVSDRADPGYGSTAKMLGESALCLALDPLRSPGGVQTPSVAMAQPLLDRLRRAGLVFAPS